MIREFTPKDREIFLTLADEFYHSPAVLHTIPTENYAKTFDAVLTNSPYVDAFLLEQDGKPAGYAQISFSHSTESGGTVAWLEELYVRPEFQGKGLGSEVFKFVDEYYAGRISRIRIEVEPDNEGALRLYRRLGYSELPYYQMFREVL